MIWTDEKIAEGIMRIASRYEPPRMPTNREVIDAEGNYKLANAIQKHGGYSEWADRLGLAQGYSETTLGIAYEHRVAEALKRMGHTVEFTSMKYAYDLLIDGVVKIDVKTAKRSYVRNSAVYSYCIAKPQQTCDFYICCELGAAVDVYVIPASACTGMKQICMGAGHTKYEKYRNAYDLISRTVDFYKGITV